MAENLTLLEAQARAAVVSNVRITHAITVTDDPAIATFRGETTIEFDVATDDAGTFLDLTAAAVLHLEVNGEAADPGAFRRDDHRLHLKGLRRGANTVRVVTDFEYSNTGVGLQRTVDPADGEVYLYTHSEPFDAHLFVPCFDQPDIKGTLALTITGPKRWTYIANQPVDSRREDGDLLVTAFATTPKLSSYLYAFACGAYVEVHEDYNGVDLALYARRALEKELREQAPEMFDVTQKGLAYYEEKFERKYPFAKYSQLMVPDFNEGAMENPGCITVNDALCVFRGPVPASLKAYRNDLILHEMAHMWFGDLVTMKWWNDLWLNESFATAMALIAERDAMQTKRPLVDFANVSKAYAMRADQMPTTHPVAAVVPDVETVRLNFDGISYDKGASLLYQLIAWVGEDAFFAGVRAYFDDHSWSNATLDDLLTALEKTSGRDLHAWSAEWLETSGVGTLIPEAVVKGGVYESFHVVQESAVPRSQRIRVGLYDRDSEGRLTRVHQADVDVTGDRTAVPALQGRPAAALVVVNDDDLGYTKIRLDETSLDTVAGGLASIDDPLTRALCWAATWDMTRDAEMPARRFVELIATQGVKEAEATVVDRLAGRADAAIAFYADPEMKPALRAQMADAARGMLRRAAPGGDLQFSWLSALIGNASRDTDFELLERLRAGTAADDAPGLELSPEARWSILVRLLAHGRAGQAEIDAELARDTSVTGARSALRARAAMPTAEAKEWAWAQLRRPDIPLKELIAVASGFQQEEQGALTRPYTDQFPELIGGWWRDLDADRADTLTGGLFPSYQIDDEALQLADAALAVAGLPHSAVRIVREEKDSVARALKARGRDGSLASL